MADWEYIECGFNAADETLNFGTRNLAGTDNLYEVCTLACIKPTKEGSTQKPNIKAVIKNGSIFFAIDNILKIFKDLLCSDLIFNVTFDYEIDTFCVTHDGKYLLICLQSGAIYCFTVDGSVIYTQKIVENKAENDSVFVDAYVENTSATPSFLLILRNGKVYRVAATVTIPVDDESQCELLQFSYELVTGFDGEVCSTAFLTPLLMVTTEEIYMYNVQTGEIDNSNISQLKKIIPCGRMFLGLGWNGNLISICTKTLLTYSVEIDTVFEDILLIKDAANSHILGVTKKNEEGISHLQLLTSPEYSTVFSFKIFQKIHLIQPEHAHDEIIFISELWHEDKINELRFQVVSETSPENRFKRLLRKQKFDEAEQFALLFHLDLEEIRKAKAEVIICKSICYESDIDNFVNILDGIKDEEFKIQSCLCVHRLCNNLEDVEKILNYGCSVYSKSDQIFCEEIQDLILQLKFRYNTFMALVRCGNRKYTVEDWDYFSECNLIEELYVTLEQNNIEESIIIFNRWDNTTISILEEKHILRIMDIINNVTINKQITFLTAFLPRTLSYLPSSLNLFTNWINKKVYQTETSHPAEFPENAINFMKKMIPLLKVETSSNFNFQQQHYCIDMKTDLLEALEQLKFLKSNYQIVVPLKQFLESKEKLISTLLLNRGIDIMANENLVEEFIQKYIRNYNLDSDIILRDVVKNITTYAEECWIKVVPIILTSIDSVQLKLEAVLIILKAANVPWCATIHEIANKSIQYSHPLVEEIIRAVKYEPKCAIFKKYPLLTKQCINSMGDLKHAMSLIIHRNRPSMIEDLYQICVSPKETHEANMLLIFHYIQTGDLTKVSEILNNNSQEEGFKCCKGLEMFIMLTINDEYGKKQLQENCYGILGFVFRKLQDNAKSYEKSFYSKSLENLRTVYKIRKDFGLMVKAQDLNLNKDKIFTTLLLNTLKNFEEKQDLSICFQNSNRISSYLGIDENLVLFKLCEQIDDFNFILQAAESMYLSDTEVVVLCQIVALILKCLGLSQDSFVKNLDLNVFINGLKLAGKIIIKAILKANTNEIGNCIDLANWIQTTYCITQEKRKNPFIENSYEGDLILPSISSLNAIKNFFLSYGQMIGPKSYVSLQDKNFDHNIQLKLNEEQSIKQIQSLQFEVASLCTEGHSLMAYKLLRTLQNGLVTNSDINTDMNIQLNDIIDKCTKQLLQNIFAVGQIDEDLAYNLLLSCESKYSTDFLFKNLKRYKRSAPKLKIIASVFLRFLQHYDMQEHKRLCISIINLFKWWNRIKNCKLPYEEFFRISQAEVLKKLITFGHLNTDSVKEFCADFKLDENTYYDFYLKNLLLNWKPDYVVEKNSDGTEVLNVTNDQELEENCMEVIKAMENTELAYDMLNLIWHSINFYHYEVFICVLNILSELKPDVDCSRKSLVLLFLKNYNRTGKPGKTEEEEWYTLYPETQSIDALSKWRLPFTVTLFTDKIWRIIRPEINLKNYTKWFEAISILKSLNKDNICSYVIKDIVSSGVFHETSNEWILHAKHNQLLSEIYTCLQHISNLEQATSVIYHLTSDIPGGADLVNAITLCYRYAQEYQNQSPQRNDVHSAFIKVKSKYYSFSTAHILHKNQLADKKYLAMISGPVHELIKALYMDERIIQKAASDISYCPNITNAVNELAVLHDIDIVESRQKLLNDWLLVTTFNMDTSNILMANDIKQQNTPNLNHYDHIIRASYLCANDDVAMWRTHLLQLGDINSIESMSASYKAEANYKANALKCFCNITDMATIEELTNTTYEDFRNLINKLTLISCLEPFGLFFNIDSLDLYNKEDLLNRLSYKMTNPVAVITRALICTTYGIEEAKYWSEIINAMLKLNMGQELKECVILLKKTDTFYNSEFYINAWKTVINNSFNFALNITESDQINLLKNNFCLIQSCPVVFALNLESVVNKCLHMKKYNFAALAVQYVTKENQMVYLKEILKVDPNIYKKIDELAKEGFWGTSFIKNLLDQQAAIKQN